MVKSSRSRVELLDETVLLCWGQSRGNLANVLEVTQSLRSRYLGCHANATRQCLYVAGSATKRPFMGGAGLRGFDCSVILYFNFNSSFRSL